MKTAVFAIILLSFNFALAHGSKSELVLAATTVAVDSFQSDEADEVINAFNGMKAWVSGSVIKVKLYYNSNKDSFSYECEMVHSDGAEEMVCIKG
ncbi:MAG: hypothetical protein ACRBBP_05055 [Bdellovibrionales bacterium]